MILYEIPRTPLSRVQRKELERAVTSMQQGLQTLSKIKQARHRSHGRRRIACLIFVLLTRRVRVYS